MLGDFLTVGYNQHLDLSKMSSNRIDYDINIMVSARFKSKVVAVVGEQYVSSFKEGENLLMFSKRYSQSSNSDIGVIWTTSPLPVAQ